MKDRRTMRARFPVLKPVEDRKIYRFVEGTEKRPRQQNLDRIEFYIPGQLSCQDSRISWDSRERRAFDRVFRGVVTSKFGNMTLRQSVLEKIGHRYRR